MDSSLALKSACLAGVLVAALGGFAQVHVERGQDGKIIVTDRSQGGAMVYAPVASALTWQHREGRLEVFDPVRKAWVVAREDFPVVKASGSLLLGCGAGSSGSAVYDLQRGEWIPQFDRYPTGEVSETLAVGYGGRGRIGLYDAREGKWQSSNLSAERIALSDNLAAFFGEHSTTTVYDAARGTWHTSRDSFNRCTLGNDLAVFYGAPGTNALVYDGARAGFVPLRDPLGSVSVYGPIAAATTPDGKAYVYTSGDHRWVEFRWDAASVEIIGGEAFVVDQKGDKWAYRPGRMVFEKIPQ
jgi:hypothetical protein